MWRSLSTVAIGTLILLSTLAPPACGARSDLLDDVPRPPAEPDHDAATADVSPEHRDAGRRPPDHDATSTNGSDASPDAPRTDANDATLRTPDASGRDATDAKSSDAGCDFTGKPRGTVETLATLGDGGILDFDLDCQGLAIATAQGGILSCPIEGCAGNATAVAPPGSYLPANLQVRIGTASLFVTSQSSPPIDAGVPNYDYVSTELFAQPRAGGPATRFFTLPSEASFNGSSQPRSAACIAGAFGAVASSVYFSVSCTAIGGIDGLYADPSFDLLSPLPDGGVSAAYFPSFLYASTAFGGGAYYTFTHSGDPGVTRVLERYAFDEPADAGGPFATDIAGAIDKYAIVASDSFVLWEDYDGTVQACPPGPFCASPVTLTSIPLRRGVPDAWAFHATHDALYFTGEDYTPDGSPLSTQSILTCPAASVLAGTCTLTPLASGLPSFPERPVTTQSNLYVLDGSSILRIAL